MKLYNHVSVSAHPLYPGIKASESLADWSKGTQHSHKQGVELRHHHSQKMGAHGVPTRLTLCDGLVAVFVISNDENMEPQVSNKASRHGGGRADLGACAAICLGDLMSQDLAL